MRHLFLFLTIVGFCLSGIWGKDIILVKKFAPDDKVRDWLKVIDRRKIKTTLIYPFVCSESEKAHLKKLLETGIISLAIEIENEPFWPLLDDFAEDITAIIANARLLDEFSLTADSLLLHQPFSAVLFRSAVSTGYRTVFNSSADFRLAFPVQRWDNLLVINVAQQIFSDSADCKNYLATSSAAVVVLYLDEKNPFGPEQFAEIATVSDEDKLISSREISLDNFAPISDINMFNSAPDILSSAENTSVWQAVKFARQKFQQYKNSGRADVAIIRQAQNKIFRLYSADWFQGRALDSFWKECRELLELLGVSPSSFSVASSSRSVLGNLPDSFRGDNWRLWSSVNPQSILSRFQVEISTSAELTFRIEMSTPLVDDFVWDIYIDLNNRRGAGSTRLLFGESDNLRPEDGWEWALTISKNSAILYKFRNFQYEVVKKYPAGFIPEEKQVYLVVPRQDIGLSPRYWGFLVLVRKQQNNIWEILDVLEESGEADFRLGKWKMLRW